VVNCKSAATGTAPVRGNGQSDDPGAPRGASSAARLERDQGDLGAFPYWDTLLARRMGDGSAAPGLMERPSEWRVTRTTRPTNARHLRAQKYFFGKYLSCSKRLFGGMTDEDIWRLKTGVGMTRTRFYAAYASGAPRATAAQPNAMYRGTRRSKGYGEARSGGRATRTPTRLRPAPRSFDNTESRYRVCRGPLPHPIPDDRLADLRLLPPDENSPE